MYKEEQLRTLLQGKRIMIAGYGREGKSTQMLLHSLLPSAVPTIVEGNEAIREEAKKGYDLIVKSPGIPTFVFEGVCDLSTITSQTDLFLQTYGTQTIGITGTKGKSTTTNLITALLQSHYADHVIMAGNMGIPLFDIVDRLDEDSIIVCEFSCHQLENIHCAPHIGVVLNLYQEHLDHYHSYLDYQLAKMNIGLKQTNADYFFYCDDNEDLCQRVTENRAALQGHVESYNYSAAKRWTDLPRQLLGSHNLCNIEVAYRVATLMGVSEEEFRSVLHDFHGLEHRLEKVGVYQGITFYNDSISTIPEACMAAVEALQDVETLILGGFDRGIDYTALIHYLFDPMTKGPSVVNIVFVGKAGRRMFSLYKDRVDGVLNDNTLKACNDAIDEYGNVIYSHKELTLQGRNILLEDDYEKILPWCFERTTPGKICLLSPAAASYDAFKNFEVRGRVFKELIKR